MAVLDDDVETATARHSSVQVHSDLEQEPGRGHKAFSTMPKARRSGKRATIAARVDPAARDTRAPDMQESPAIARPRATAPSLLRQVPVRRYVSRITRHTLAVIMAGGRGERLKHLTDHRCKPATPFGGKFRIIDF